MYKQQEACFWTAEEIDLAQDLRDWEGLKPDEQHFIKYVLMNKFISKFISDMCLLFLLHPMESF